MQPVPPPDKPPVIYWETVPSPTPRATPPTVKPPKDNAVKTVNQFLNDMRWNNLRGDGGIHPTQPQVPPFDFTTPTLPPVRPKLGTQAPSVPPSHTPIGAGEVATIAGGLFGLGIFLTLGLAALCSMFSGFFMYLGAMMCRALLNGLSRHYAPDDFEPRSHISARRARRTIPPVSTAEETFFRRLAEAEQSMTVEAAHRSSPN